MLTRPEPPFTPFAPFTDEDARRFWQKVAIGDPADCWPWIASRGGPGYGHAWCEIDGERRCLDAHRLAWLIACGPVPPGTQVLHMCNLKTCVNPAHLALGTASDNARQALADGLMRTKLAPGDALDVIRQRQAGRLIIEIAGRRGVRAGHVKRILAGECWGCVTGITAPSPPPSDTGQPAQLALSL